MDRFFQKFLPSKYAIDKGFVFDSQGNVSDQIDIIIFDALYTPLIFGTDAGEKFVTAESVYAVFDSKPEISKETLDYTDKKIKSIRLLKRYSRGVINAGKYWELRKLTTILGGILAVNSSSIDTIEKHIKMYENIELGCTIKKHSFLVNRKDNKIMLSHA